MSTSSAISVRFAARVLLPVAVVLVSAAMAGSNPNPPPWDQILGPAQGTLPPPRPALDRFIELPTFRTTSARTNINWETDLAAALRTAKQENRPLFVTMRCLPCRACSEFDKDVLNGGPDLDPLYLQFVTVRLTNTKDIDLRLLPMDGFQDMDVSWWGWFLSPEGRVYGIFGGRDHISDATRNSRAALANTMKRILAHHYDPRRPAWDIDGPAPDLSGQATTPADLPGFQSWLRFGANQEHFTSHNCIHCHQVAEILRQPAIETKTFDKQRDLDVWPLPENLGLKLDRDDGLRIEKVEPGSPAAGAGLKPGDRLGAAGGRRLFSQADFRGVLHRTPRSATSLPLYYLRDGEVLTTALDLPEGWRKTRLEWRTSVVDAGIGASPGFWPVDASRFRERLGIPPDAMAVEAYVGKPSGPAFDAGLKPGEIIIAVDGQSPKLEGRAWLYWFKMKYDPGDRITLTVRDRSGGDARDITFTAR